MANQSKKTNNKGLLALLVLSACNSAVASTARSTSTNYNIHRRPLAITKKPLLSPSRNVFQVPRGGSDETPTATAANGNLVVDAIKTLNSSMKGGKSDTLLLLGTTAVVPAICQIIKMSPILGMLFSGVILGPQGKNLIADIHTTEMLADLGVVLFLFEMGIHLSFKTLIEMRRTVFGLGGCQFIITAFCVAMIARVCGLDTGTQIVLGGGLALSSSAFVLQLLKDKDQMQTSYGKNSFGVLLLQDLAVVPLMVVIPLLATAGKEGGVSTLMAVTSALVKAAMALTGIGLLGTFGVPPLFKMVTKAKSQEAMIGVSLLTILGFSFLTEGLGLSNTLGAFLAGVLLSETPFRHVVETEMSPIRGILVGLFFFSVGFEIDLPLIVSSWPLITTIVVGMLSLKIGITTLLCLAFGLPMSTAQRVGLVLSQGAEFAFVAFRLARSMGVLDGDLTKLMLTCVSLTMAVTPFLEEFGSSLALKMQVKEVSNGATEVSKKKK